MSADDLRSPDREETPATDRIKHGSHYGYQRCVRRPEGSCDPCKAANTAYHRGHRANNPERRAHTREQVAAYNRATRRLRQAHRAEFQRLYDEEKGS